MCEQVSNSFNKSLSFSKGGSIINPSCNCFRQDSQRWDFCFIINATAPFAEHFHGKHPGVSHAVDLRVLNGSKAKK